jgi:pyruvate dehydrogenase E2 component (dihydrolipoamide acetyltransferase)
VRNLDLDVPGPPSAFRRISLASWRAADDPTVYGAITVNMAEALKYLEAWRAATGRRLTVNHLMARTLGEVLVEVPDANVLIRRGGVYHRRDHTVFFQVAMEDPATGKVDLSGVTIDRANERDLANIQDCFERAVRRVRKAEDKELEGTRQLMKRLPTWVVAWLMRALPLVLYSWNLDLSWAGIPGRTFGAIAVTNIGSLGIEEAYVPLVPYTRTPIFVALGAIAPSPVVLADGTLGVAPTMRIMASFDHRALDGVHAARMCQVVRRWLEDPWTHFGPIPEPGNDRSPASDEPGTPRP